MLDVPEPPGQPDSPTAIASSETTAAAFWQPPEDTGDSPIRNYDLRYRIDGSADWFTHTPGAPLSTAILNDLVPEATYELQVRAHNDAGPGPWSGPGYVTLPERAEQPVDADTDTDELAEDDLADDKLEEDDLVRDQPAQNESGDSSDADESSEVDAPRDDEASVITPAALPTSGSGGLSDSTSAAYGTAWTWVGLTLISLGLVLLLILARFGWLRR